MSPLADEEFSFVPLPSSMVFEHSPGTFTYEELELATEGFSESNFLGQGGFGTVHKGILPNKQAVAIKQQKSESKQGTQEFQTEVNVISRVHHKHLVSLVGYCIAKAQMTLMLVYEFFPNKTLDFHLHGRGTETLDWSTRMKIASGSAKGLAYLHEDCEPKIIHRDIKAANILPDNNFEPKARPLLSTALGNRNFEVLADPRLQNYNSEEMFRMASCAANCVRHSLDHRPRMSQVGDALTGKINLDNWTEESTQVDNQDLNKFWKQSQGECNEPISTKKKNSTGGNFRRNSVRMKFPTDQSSW